MLRRLPRLVTRDTAPTAAMMRRLSVATAEAANKHVPWGALGSGTYTAATKGCFDVINNTQPLVQAALERALDARSLNKTANVTPFAIADFGTADAGTSLPLMCNIVRAVREAEPRAPIVVHYEDQALNDWQSVFQLTSGALPGGPKTFMDGSVDNVFVLASGASFYEQCFAPGSIDLGYCATAMHWLTDVPCRIPDALHSACSNDATTRAAFAEQAATNWEHILLKRAAELKAGGQFVVANFAIDDAGQFLGHSERVASSMHHNFAKLWREVAGDEVAAATTFCNEYRSLAACEAAFAPGTAVSKAGLVLHSSETQLVECPFHGEWMSGAVTDPRQQAKNFVPTTRTWSNSTFVSGALACGHSAADAAALADTMFARYEALVAEAPQDHAMDYVHSYLHVGKQ